MGNKFKWGFIGAGNIARKVARELTENENHEIVGVFSNPNDKTLRFSERYNCRLYNSIEGLLKGNT